MRRQETFKTAMRQNAMEFDEARARTPPDLGGKQGDGLNFHEFCHLVRDREDGEFTEQELRERFLALDLTGSGLIEKHEYLRFSLRDALARSVTRVMEIFTAWDTNDDGEVSRAEFLKAVRALGFSDCSDRDIDHVFREYDEDDSGSVSQRELERKLKKYAGVLTEQRFKLRRTGGGRKGAALGVAVKLDRSSGRPVSELLREALSEHSVRVMDLFRDWDENGDGLIQRDEFVRSMAPLGIEVSKQEAIELFDQFDPDGSGEIDFKELNHLLRRRVDVQAQKRAARKLAQSQSSPSMRAAAVLAQPTIPPLAKLPSVASLPRFEGTLGSIAGNELTEFEPTTFTATGALASRHHEISSLGASRGGRSSLSAIGPSRKGDRLLSHYTMRELPRQSGMLTPSPSLPTIVSGEVARYQAAVQSEALIRSYSLDKIMSRPTCGTVGCPTNVWDWPAVQGVPNLDHLAQLWLAPRIGPAWRVQPNQTRVVLPPMSSRIERAKKEQQQLQKPSALQRTAA